MRFPSSVLEWQKEIVANQFHREFSILISPACGLRKAFVCDLFTLREAVFLEIARENKLQC